MVVVLVVTIVVTAKTCYMYHLLLQCSSNRLGAFFVLVLDHFLALVLVLASIACCYIFLCSSVRPMNEDLALMLAAILAAAEVGVVGVAVASVVWCLFDLFRIICSAWCCYSQLR